MTSTLPIQQPSLGAAQTANGNSPLVSAFARTLRTFAEREQVNLAYTPFGSELDEIDVEPLPRKKGPSAVGSPLTSGVSLKKKEESKISEPLPPAPAQETVTVVEKETAVQPVANGLLTRGWAWLKKNNKFTATKQLRVAETVSLGEKRFVSVILVDGQKFLIGGGSQGVTLLTQLGSSQTASSEALEAIANVGEQLK
jgi:hypothetical protein